MSSAGKGHVWRSEAPTGTWTRLSRNLGQVLLFDRCRAAGLARVCSALCAVLPGDLSKPC